MNEEQLVFILMGAITSAMLLVLGLILINGKGAFLIAGYNTMSKEEKSKYNQTALCKFMGKIMFCLAGSCSLWILCGVLAMDILFFIGLFIFFAILIFAVVYSNTKNRFKNM